MRQKEVEAKKEETKVLQAPITFDSITTTVEKLIYKKIYKKKQKKNINESRIFMNIHIFPIFLQIFVDFLDPRQSRKGPMNSALCVRP